MLVGVRGGVEALSAVVYMCTQFAMPTCEELFNAQQKSRLQLTGARVTGIADVVSGVYD